ncbi:MAG: hypothetical protein E7474_08285 [Ruminococcaceae bacterium]|nr:hypothetical protein [Oscillospiraceae bacterium]
MSDAHNDPMHGRTGEELEQISGQGSSNENSARWLTGELDKLLQNGFGESVDVDELDALLDRLDEAVPDQPDVAAFDAEEGLRRFHERLEEREAREGDQTAARSFGSSVQPYRKHGFFKTVLIAAAIGALILGTTAQAMNWNIFERIAQWTSELFGLRTEVVEVAEITANPLASGEERQYETVQEMLDEFGITAPLFPTWVPERFGASQISAANTKNVLSLYAEYSNKDEFLMIRAYEVDQSNSRDTEINVEGADLSAIYGRYYYFMSDTNVEKAVWQNGCFECHASGTVSREEMKQIVSSIDKG